MMKTMNIYRFLILLGLLVSSSFIWGQSTPPWPITNANWVAVDSLGRAVPDFKTVGPPKAKKYVGLFYYLWHGAHGRTVYDNTKIIAANTTNPAYGPTSAFHWWGESEAGYYVGWDKWLIRRNLQMFANAGVDFLYFDLTNNVFYERALDSLCKVSLEMRGQGIKTPYFVFTLHSNAGEMTNNLYDNIYSKNKYKDLWFYWEGKPLLLTDLSFTNVRPEVKSFFNSKNCWAWTNSALPNQWQWQDYYPQNWGWTNKNTDIEQLPVSVASHATLNIGDSYKGGVQPGIDKFGITAFTGQGRHFDEQWSRVFALSSSPNVVMVTQWNEWMAQRMVLSGTNTQSFLGRNLLVGQSFFVDAYNQEFNRDIEPMKGGHTDNKYYQMLSNIRKYKGMIEPEVSSSPQSISIDGSFEEWQSVKPKFSDPIGDTYHRSEVAYENGRMNINNKGRNDIIEAMVAIDPNNVYFYAKTNADLTTYIDNNWMLCFIDSDKNFTTGWKGFDYVIGVGGEKSETELPFSKWTNNTWSKIGNVNYKLNGKQMEVSIPRKSLGLNTSPEININFQWADNIQKLNDINEFFINGDVAPDRRFRFTYTNSSMPTSIKVITQDSPITISPNPALDLITVKGIKMNSIVDIQDVTGKIIFSKTAKTNDIEIDVTKFSKGIYYLISNNLDNKLTTSTFIKL
jgi:hypothetical protein